MLEKLLKEHHEVGDTNLERDNPLYFDLDFQHFQQHQKATFQLTFQTLTPRVPTSLHCNLQEVKRLKYTVFSIALLSSQLAVHLPCSQQVGESYPAVQAYFGCARTDIFISGRHLGFCNCGGLGRGKSAPPHL